MTGTRRNLIAVALAALTSVSSVAGAPAATAASAGNTGLRTAQGQVPAAGVPVIAAAGNTELRVAQAQVPAAGMPVTTAARNSERPAAQGRATVADEPVAATVVPALASAVDSREERTVVDVTRTTDVVDAELRQGAATSSAVELTDAALATSRLAGGSRFETAVAVSKRAFPSTARSVYLARADRFSDALAGGALTDGPVLLVPSTGPVPAAVLAEVRRLQPAEVVALGGTAAVSQPVLDSAAQGRRTARLTGADRFATAAAISRRAFPTGSSEVYVAGANDSPDAVVGGVLHEGPVLPVPATGAVPAVITAEIARLAPASVFGLGGASAVADSVLRDAAAGRQTARLAGATRYETAALIARHAFPGGAPTTYLARGDVFVDAVAGGALTDGPILLVPPPGVNAPGILDEVVAEADQLGIEAAIALGGPAAVSDATLTTVGAGVPGGTEPVVTPPAPTPPVPPTTTILDPRYCDDAITRTWPIRLDVRYTISCVDEVMIDGEPAGPGVLGITASSVYLDSGELASGQIQILRGLSIDLTDVVIMHELAHAYSYANLTQAQRTWFAQQVGQASFESGSYADLPTEIWANTQGACAGYPVPDARRTVSCELLTATERR